MAATLKIPTIFTAVDKFSTIMRTMTKSVRSWSNKSIASVRRFDQKISKTFSKLSSFAQIGLGLGIGLILREGLTAITDFETGLVGVGKTTGIANKELKTLGFDILKLSKNLKTVSAVKLLELAQAAGQMGIDAPKDILKFTSTLAQLEKATDIIGAEGAASMARLLEITDEGPDVIDKFGSALVALGNKTKATESEILGVASRVARATSDFNLASHEVLGIAATLKEIDVAPEAAGTVIGKVFRSIELATIKGGKTLQAYGKIMELTPKQVKKAFGESPLKAFNLFIKGLSKIKKEGGSVQKAMLDVGLRGDRLAAVIPVLAKKFELLDKKMELSKISFKENTALGIEFAESQKTINSALNTIKNSFNRLLTAEALQGSKLQIIQKLLFFVADNMGKIITVIAVLIGSYLAMKAILIASTIASAAYNIVLGITSALSGTASIAIGKNAIALGAYKVALAISTAAQWLFNAAMTANPIVLIILAVIAAIVLIVLAFKNWDAITAWFSKRWEKFTSFISDAWKGVIQFFQDFSFKDFFIDIGKSIVKFLLSPIKMVLKLIRLIPGKDIAIVTKGLDFIDKLEGSIDDIGTPVLDSPEISASKSTIESIQKNNIMLEIRDKGNNVERVESKGDINIDIKLTPTQGAT